MAGSEPFRFVQITSSNGAGRHHETREFALSRPGGFAVFTFRGAILARNVTNNAHVIVEFRDKAARASGGGRAMEGRAEALVSGGEYEEIRAKAWKFLAPLLAVQRTTARFSSVLLRQKVDFRDCAIVVELEDL